MTYLSYLYLLTPLHTGASSQAGNLMGIARETHTNLPYIPASSLRGKIRSEVERRFPESAGAFFGERIKDGQQPTEGEVWLADASLLLFPIASFSHQFVWITCPLWLSRWNRWLQNDDLNKQVRQWKALLETDSDDSKQAVSTIKPDSIYLQGAILQKERIESIQSDNACLTLLKKLPNGNEILDLDNKLLILSDKDCANLVETGLQREVRVALDTKTKTVDGGSFRSEESIPSETVLFFSWGLKTAQEEKTQEIHAFLPQTLLHNNRLQFGGLEGIGHGWTQLTTEEIAQNVKN